MQSASKPWLGNDFDLVWFVEWFWSITSSLSVFLYLDNKKPACQQPEWADHCDNVNLIYLNRVLPSYFINHGIPNSITVYFVYRICFYYKQTNSWDSYHMISFIWNWINSMFHINSICRIYYMHYLIDKLLHKIQYFWACFYGDFNHSQWFLLFIKYNIKYNRA